MCYSEPIFSYTDKQWSAGCSPRSAPTTPKTAALNKTCHGWGIRKAIKSSLNSNSLEQILICTFLLRSEYKIAFLVPFDVNWAFYMESLQVSTATSANSSGKPTGGLSSWLKPEVLMDEFRAHPSADITLAYLLDKWTGICPCTGQSGSWESRQNKETAIISSDQSVKHAQELTLRQKGISFQWQRGTRKQQLLKQDLPAPGISPHCPKDMAEVMLLECTVPAWLLQCRGTFSDTLESCQLQWMRTKSSDVLTWSGKLMQRLPSSLYLAFLICGSAYLCWIETNK